MSLLIQNSVATATVGKLRNESGARRAALPIPHSLFPIPVLLALLLATAQAHAQTASSWSAIGNPSGPSRITALLNDARSASTILMASPGGGIWRTEDDGSNWASLTEATSTLSFCELARDPSNADILYAGTGDPRNVALNQGVLRSGDGGRSWSASLPFTNSAVCALAVDPTDGRRISAAADDGLYLSADSGATYRRLQTAVFTAVAFDAQGKLYAARLGLSDLSASPLGGRATILLTSSNGGASFSTVVLPETANSSGSRTTHVALLARAAEVYAAVSYLPSDGSGAAVDVYRSLDNGGTWSVLSAVAQAAPPARLAAEPQGDRVFLATGDSVLSSINRGQAWAKLSTLRGRHHAVAITSSSIWVAGDFGMERLPLNGGAIALQVPGPSTQQIQDIAAGNINDIYAAGPSGVLRFDGTNPLWSTLLIAEGMSGVVAGTAGNPTQRNVVAAGTRSLQHSTNGTDFSTVSSIAVSEARSPAPPLLGDPGSLANVYFGGQTLYRSTDQGATFSNFATVDPDRSRVVIAMTAAPSARRFMYAATACVPALAGAAGCAAVSYIWRSTNSGQTWVQAAPVTGWVYSLAVDTRQTQTVYAAVGNQPFATSSTAEFGDIVRSTDNAASWTSIRSNLPRSSFRSIGVDATAPAFGNQPIQNLFVGGDKGVFLTFNNGTQWVALNAGLPRTPVAVLRQTGSDGLIAGTLGRAAYNGRIAGLAASLVANPLEVSATLAPGQSTTVAISLTNVLNAVANWSVNATTLTPGNWLVLGSGGGVAEPRAAVSLSLRLDASTLTAGTHSALIQLTSGPAGGATLSQVIPVTLRVESTTLSLAAVSPLSQTGAVGTALPPLVVALTDEQGQPVAGESISFAISGGGTISRRTMNTLADGTANTILTLPAVAGTTIVTASYRDQSVTFTAQASAVARPALQANSVVSAATFLAGTLSPGEIISIFGQSLATGAQNAASLPLPTTLRTTRALLRVDGADVALPLFYVSATQVNAILPMGLPGGTYNFTVEAGGVRGNDVQLAVAAFAPGIFTVDGTGRGAGIFLKGDGSLVSSANAAARGSVVSFYAVGLGAVNPTMNAGEAGRGAEPLNRVTTTPRVFFDNLEGAVSFSGIAPGFAGLYQVNVQVPAGLVPASNIPVSMTISGAASNRVTIPVQ